MKAFLSGPSLLALLSFAISLPAVAHAEDDAASPLRDVIIVTGARAQTPATIVVERPGSHPLEGPDAATLLARVPGGARVGNGALSGQAQYQGLFGPRLNARIDGQRFASGGPNLMDPPLHYAPPPLVSALEIDRGVSPVRDGPGLGGGLNAILKRVDFSDAPDLALRYDVTAAGRSADDSYAVGGVVGASNRTFRFNVIGSREEGDDTKFPGGRIADSAFERTVYGASFGARSKTQEAGFEFRRQETGPTGNPPFPMDIPYVDANFARANYRGSFGKLGLEASAGYAGVNHAMNNFDLRPAPSPMMLRETTTDAKTYAGRIAASYPALSGLLRLGGDVEKARHDVTIANPDNAAFFIHSLSGFEDRRIGAFVEWTGAVGPLNGEIGARVDDRRQKAGEASTGPAAPMGAMMLAAAFNAGERERADKTVDAAARFWTTPADGFSWRLTLARKTRVPNYVERFSWLPTNASGGLADGNIYVGDLKLKPETAWIAQAGFDYASARAYFRPAVFFKRIDNYIQGVPFDATPGVIDSTQEMIASMNGDSTPLRFANVDARLYGADFDAGLALTSCWRADLLGSYVRGERRDIKDNLYRIAPPSLTAGLTYDRGRWSATFESRLVAAQNNVSATNGEARTGGYAIFNLYGDWKVADGVRLSAALENLFNRRYEDHLAGYNRVTDSDVAVGARLPGAGRGVFVRINLAG